MPPPAAPVTEPETERIAAWLTRVTKARGPFELSLIAGGASPRRFYRVRSGLGAAAEGTAGVIVMSVPPETPDVAFARERGRGWPFLEVRALLASAGVPVPAILAEACDEGLLLVEDLGPTLAEHLAVHQSAREALYRCAALDLGRAQAALAPLPADSVVRLRQFDDRLLHAELEHFWEWAIAARNVDAPRARFERARDYLVAEIAALPRAFTHRDYQSRNLLVLPRGPATGGRAPDDAKLGWIDFQDALLGPRAYDLVALLCDSYQPFDRAFVEARLDDYAAARALSVQGRGALGREFDLITLQRKLKDAGRFVFIEKKRGDASFLPFVAPTLAIVENALERLAGFPELEGLGSIVRAARGAA
ncbi:MAG TPA: phosphotransferase [Polyangiaceae bacterium]|nr:phosphotransferase [Polyangiaceae bacterium]